LQYGVSWCMLFTGCFEMSMYYALVDCNNFYASCERIFNPEICNRPVIVLSNNDGCVVSRSQEAKDAGVPFAVPYFKIRDLIKRHNIAVFSSNYTLYADISSRVMSTLENFSPEIEVYSIDEAFLVMRGEPASYPETGFEIKKRIQRDIGIPVSVGIAKTKTLAKIAGTYAKKNPDSQGVVFLEGDSHVKKVLSETPVENIWGIGPAHAGRLKLKGALNALDFSFLQDDWVKRNMTITGLRTLHEVRGHSCLKFDDMPSPKKSILSSRSFGKLVTDLSYLRQAVATHVSRAAEKLRDQKSAAASLTVFIKTDRFRNDPQYSRSITMELTQPTADTSVLLKASNSLLGRLFMEGYGYKKAGVMLSGLVPGDSIQMSFFAPRRRHSESLMETMDLINKNCGSGKLFYASAGTDKAWHMKRDFLSPRYTTRWEDIPVVKI